MLAKIMLCANLTPTFTDLIIYYEQEIGHINKQTLKQCN